MTSTTPSTDEPIHPSGLQFQYLAGTADEPSATFEYRSAWDFQRQVHDQVASHQICNQVLYVQHDPVYTAGRRTEPSERPQDGTPVVDVDRGGKITWHGPGQLVGYPIVFLPGRVGVVDYVRRLEEAIIRYLASLGITSGRVAERTGVWLPATSTRPERKICAIGIRVSRRTTIHGFALNVSNGLERFENIIPCGIADAGVGAIIDELGSAPSLAQVGRDLEPYLTQMMAFEPYEPSPDLASL